MATLKEVAQVAVEARRDKGSGSGKRLREIERILRQHRVLSGLTPEKATSLLEDLGPTFVKMGQIAANRSDVIPPAYADAFKRLRADVPPMPFSTVLATIEESLGHPWRETFSCIEEKPLGSASIAQVHRARIAPHAVGDAGAGTGAAAVPLPADAPKAGSYVAIKVRRPHVVEQMTQDLALIRQAVALVGLTRRWTTWSPSWSARRARSLTSASSSTISCGSASFSTISREWKARARIRTSVPTTCWSWTSSRAP